MHLSIVLKKKAFPSFAWKMVMIGNKKAYITFTIKPSVFSLKSNVLTRT